MLKNYMNNTTKNLVVFGVYVGDSKYVLKIICFGWLGSGNSNICYFNHPETWGNDPI